LPAPLGPIERRVLGVLLEKSLAQPSYYPMTLNALIAGCNQTSARDPVMNLDEDTVWNALEALRQRGLVSKVMAGMSGRVDRFKHEVKAVFGWEKPARAVMAELLLRGPQTLGELRSRGARMFPFDNAEAVTAVVEALSQSDSPSVAPLPRSPGRSATRYTHLLYPDDERPAATEGAAVVTAAAQPRDAAPASGETALLRRQLAEVQAEIADLRQALADLRQRLEVIEG
jgi:uncharacterized protein YceH (UPF0502 family)